MANRRAKGGSDDEIKELTNDQKKVADPIKTQWTDEDKMMVVRYITLEKVWKNFRATKAKDFIYVYEFSFECFTF